MASSRSGFLDYVSLLILIGLICTPSSASAIADPPEMTAREVQRFFDAAFVTQKQEHAIVGAIVSVVHEGEVIFKKGYGWADLESRTAADPDRSLFRIASISKPFVWTAVMQLAEDGRLSLDDDVNDHLQAFKIPETFSEPIRIRHLLSHTPGFEDQAIGMHARSIETRIPIEEYLANHMPARVRPPGMHAAYSNWSTTLAAYIVQIVTGQPWADYIDEQILDPLQMNSTNTHTQLTDDFAERIATSYTWASGRFTAKPYEYMNDEPAGMISTSASDMARFMMAHLNDGALDGTRILSESTARQMRSPLFDPHPGIAPMLHGFYRADRNGQIIFGHGGDTNQFHSQLSLFPEHNLGVFVSFNSDPADAARSRLLPAFVDFFFPVPYLRPAPDPVSVDLEEYAGEYIPLRSNSSTLERLGVLVTALTITAGQEDLVLNGGSSWIPMGEDRFTGRYRNRLMVFEREGDAVSHLMITEPLSTFKRVRGLDAPGNQQVFIGLMILIALIAVCGYGYRAFSRAQPDRRLPRAPVAAAWLHAFLLVVLYLYLANVLSGDVEEFVFGVPADARINVWLLVANTMLGIVVVFFAARHWLNGTATAVVRMRYSMVAVAALMNLWVAWYFNILTFPFTY